MKSKFERIYENYSNKFTKGGFLPGDFVKFKSDALSNSSIQAGSDEYKAKIKELIDSDKNIRISQLTSTDATKSADPDGTADQYNATIYQAVPGNMNTSGDHLITVPVSVLERVAGSSDETQVKVPDSFKRAADKKVNHTNANKSSADLQDDSYDKGKDWEGGKRSGKTGDMDDEFEKDSDATGVKKKVKNESVVFKEDVKLSENLKFYVYSNQEGEWVHERNVSTRENIDVERMFKKWIKAESGGEFKVLGTDPTNSGGEYYARIADSRDGVRVMDSNSFFVGSVEDTTPKA